MSGPEELSRLRVLVVDDDASFRLHMRLLLEQLGVGSVELAEDGRRAVERIEEIDLLLLDVMMPDMDGVEVSQRLAENGFSGGVALVTGSEPSIRDMAELFAKSLGLRFLGTVRKPIELETLRRLLSSLQE